MCILFVLVGDSNSPTIICNNRDEYFFRPTLRGKLENKKYSPLDVEGGGSWIALDGVHGNPSELKYAIVLNYHSWRYPESQNLFLKGEAQSKSRGLLISQFINPNGEDSKLSAFEYAHKVYNNRYNYRAFNLIVGDYSGTYYITSHPSQSEPYKLKVGEFYGFSNGYMNDPWQKVIRGSERLKSTIRVFLDKCTPSVPRSIISKEQFIAQNLSRRGEAETRPSSWTDQEARLRKRLSRLLRFIERDVMKVLSVPTSVFSRMLEDDEYLEYQAVIDAPRKQAESASKGNDGSTQLSPSDATDDTNHFDSQVSHKVTRRGDVNAVETNYGSDTDSLVSMPSVDEEDAVEPAWEMLEDPTFGHTSRAAMQLSSIFVPPTIIEKDQRLFGSQSRGPRALGHSDSHGGGPQKENSAPIQTVEDYLIETRGPQHRDSSVRELLLDYILNHFKLVSKDNTPSSSYSPPPTADRNSMDAFEFQSQRFQHTHETFGTRTTTLFVHIPVVSCLGEGVSSVVKAPRHEKTTQIYSEALKNDSIFYIVERDLDPEKNEWSSHRYSNLI